MKALLRALLRRVDAEVESILTGPQARDAKRRAAQRAAAQRAAVLEQWRGNLAVYAKDPRESAALSAISMLFNLFLAFLVHQAERRLGYPLHPVYLTIFLTGAAAWGMFAVLDLISAMKIVPHGTRAKPSEYGASRLRFDLADNIAETAVDLPPAAADALWEYLNAHQRNVPAWAALWALRSEMTKVSALTLATARVAARDDELAAKTLRGRNPVDVMLAVAQN